VGSDGTGTIVRRARRADRRANRQATTTDRFDPTASIDGCRVIGVTDVVDATRSTGENDPAAGHADINLVDATRSTGENDPAAGHAE
jgi:hypothetical protein